MHVLLYEWATGGGLVEEAGPPASLLQEGAAMIAALAEDFVRLDDCRVTLLRDVRLADPPPRGCRVVDVHHSAQAREELIRLGRLADCTLVIAPEFDGILRKTLAALRRHDVATLNAACEFVRVASDKQATAESLAKAGVPVPYAVVLPADAERLPRDFPYPGVLKPLDGAGSQHTYLVEGPGDRPDPYPWPRRLERYCRGRAASVAALCTPRGIHPLPPCWQRLSADGRFTYLGGQTIREPDPAGRAVRLALQALSAMPPGHGWVGVDLVLGDDPQGGDDAAIEINPRLTTSYVGLRAAVAENLAGAMLAGRNGPLLPFTPVGAGVEFTAEGGVRLLGE